MSRVLVMGLGFGLLALTVNTQAGAVGPMDTAQAQPKAAQQPVILAMSERQKCKALNRCRQKYTHCYNKLERQHRVAEKDEVCVPPYQKCINASFGGMDWFFTRWFNPSYLDCRQYPG